MAVRKSPPLLLLRAVALGFVLLVFFVGRPQAQAPAPATVPRTDPLEASSLNSIFKQWGLRQWPDLSSIHFDPCRSFSFAVDSTDLNDGRAGVFFKCTCNNATCHITQLKVYAFDVVGRIPDELKNLKFLFQLNLAQNYLTGPLPAFIGNLTALKYLSLGINALSGPLPKELGNLRQLVALGTRMEQATQPFFGYSRSWCATVATLKS